ncbi:MAG: 16S rRNA (cytidine(1402)-2'-O)-methyltransferase, partial [Alphaproteobacteria bacterium]|nr:16S rRNA (cytidine(1402)-2'-O)-methyltransferase [Alphaproteobacteria bacterium]
MIENEEYPDFKAEIGPSKYEAGTKNKIKPGLYIVATPIGNLRDITLRALDIFEAADIVLCEDTRITKRLLNAYGIQKQLLAYHDHNADKMRPKVIEELQAGKIIAQASDAGTPLISDPGYKLVRDCLDNNFDVYPIPGASAPLTALAAAGLPSDKFMFIGFLPTKKMARISHLRENNPENTTLICFESPKRLSSAIKDIAEVWPDRQIVVARELTKMFEEFKRGTATELSAYYEEASAPKGEIVILLGPMAKQEADEKDVLSMLKDALKDNSLRD